MKKYEKAGIGRILLGIASVLLVLVLITGITVGVLSDGFRSWDKFGKTDTEQTRNDGAVTDENGNEMESGKVYPLSRNMTFTAPTAATANASGGITVTATVTPEEATYKELDWSVSFVNPQSAWAGGKTVTDYVTVTPNADDSSVATVRCLAAFGERIKITVTSKDNPDASAECVVDYGSRVNGGEYALEANGFDFELEGVLPFYVDFDDLTNVGSYVLTCELNAVYDPVYTKKLDASSEFVLRTNPFIKRLLAFHAPVQDLGYEFGVWEFSFEEFGAMPLCLQLFDSLLTGNLSDTTVELHSMLVSTLNEQLNLPENDFSDIIDSADDPDLVREGYDRFVQFLEAHSGAEEYEGILPLFELVGSVENYECYMSLGVRFTDFFVPVDGIGLDHSGLVF